jgi:hypothetical protein
MRTQAVRPRRVHDFVSTIFDYDLHASALPLWLTPRSARSKELGSPWAPSAERLPSPRTSRRLAGFFRSDGDMPPEVSLRLDRPPGFESDEAIRTRGARPFASTRTTPLPRIG